MNKTFFKVKLFVAGFALFQSFVFSQEENGFTQMKLPTVTTYIRKSLENKITYNRQQIEQQHFQDLPQLLCENGIQLISYGDYGLEQKPSIRGFTDETVRVVIDGVCANNQQTGTFDFSSINLNNVETLEIIKGGYTEGTQDEGAVGGVIYITTKKGFDKEFQTDTKVKTFFNAQTPVDLISQNISFALPFDKEFFLNGAVNATKAENNYQKNDAAVKDLNVFLKTVKYFGDGNSITFSTMDYAGEKNLPGVEFSTDNENQKDLNFNVSASLFTPNLFSFFNLKNTVVWQNNNRNYVLNTEESVHRLNNFVYTMNVDFFEWKKVQQKAGVTFEFTHLDSTNDGTQIQFSGVIKETTRFFVNDFFSLSVPFGAKFSNQNFSFLPKLAVCFDFSQLSSQKNFFPVAVTLNVYKIVQFPTMDDLYWQGENFHGNADLKPENGWGSDITFDYQKNFTKGELLKTGLTCFTNYYENKIQWACTENEWQPQNVASAFYFGMDFSLGLHLFQNHLKINVCGEYLYTRLLDKSNKYTYGKKIMWTPDFTATACVRVDYERWNCNVTANYVGKRYISNLNVGFLQPYVLVSAGAEVIPVKNLVFYIRGDNLLNAKYESIENYVTPGISLTLGVKINLGGASVL